MADDMSLDIIGLSAEDSYQKSLANPSFHAGKLPLVPAVSEGGDAGKPIMVQSDVAGEEVRSIMMDVAKTVARSIRLSA
jgi:hypothetical protein